MRLFTHISFLATLLAIFAGASVALVGILMFECPPIFLLCVVPVACISYFLSLIIAHFISQPLRELIHKAQAYRAGDKSVRFTKGYSMREVDEAADLFSSFASLYESRLDELAKVKKTQDSFVSDVAHELRTPLTAISGNAELMLDPDMPQSTREHFCRIILEESERLKKLTNQLLALQHIQEGASPVTFKRLNIEDVARDVIDVLEPLAQDKNVELSIDGVAPDILGDTDRLKQALINLVDNAIRHADKGGHVQVLLSGLKDQALVAVKDDGCGFGDVDPSLLFKRFYRADASRARNSGGAGLGLAIVKSIVESHDGTVSAAQAPEGGAIFVMSFPAVK